MRIAQTRPELDPSRCGWRNVPFAIVTNRAGQPWPFHYSNLHRLTASCSGPITVLV
jgi:hypothetical protein